MRQAAVVARVGHVRWVEIDREKRRVGKRRGWREGGYITGVIKAARVNKRVG